MSVWTCALSPNSVRIQPLSVDPLRDRWARPDTVMYVCQTDTTGNLYRVFVALSRGGLGIKLEDRIQFKRDAGAGVGMANWGRIYRVVAIARIDNGNLVGTMPHFGSTPDIEAAEITSARREA